MSPPSTAEKTMASPSTTEAPSPAESAILTHMNADHAASLSLYLRHYLSLPASAAKNPTLTAITPTHLTILAADGTSHLLPLTPPLPSLAAARPRLVAMHRAASLALGPLVSTYTPPRAPGHVIVAGLVLFYLFSFALRARVVPGSLPYSILERAWPFGGADGYLWLQRVIFAPVVLVHALETGVIAWRLRGAGVGIGKGVWWAWMGSCAVEGVGAHQRFGAAVRRGERARKEAEASE